MLSPVHGDRARVAELAAEIPMLERSLSALRDEKMRVQARLDAVKYPVLTLPNEIVSEIFFHFLPVYPLYPPFVGILSPTTLTHICRRWREIALATPILWSIMFFSGRKLPEHVGPRCEPALVRELRISDIWMRRSLPRPLSIAIDDRCWPKSEVFKVIVPHRARWEHLTIHTGPFQLPQIVGPMPMLRHLDLSVDDPIPLITLVKILDVLQLRTAVLSGFGIANLALPYAQLTSLTLNRVDQDVYRPILRQTSHLRRLELNFVFRRDEDSYNPRQELILPCLETLIMNEPTSYRSARRIPDLFVVPALHTLQIPEFFLRPNPVDTLRAFISTASCTLQSVRITAIRYIIGRPFRKMFQNVDVSFDPSDNSDDSNDSGDDSDSGDNSRDSSSDSSTDE
ncbi:hypothetical protein DFH06DRAFT_1476158 [Mycena polygramma]|nr:hypothetical protein DFH06DRAFT_1476158 [Mycena polygramma]